MNSEERAKLRETRADVLATPFGREYKLKLAGAQFELWRAAPALLDTLDAAEAERDQLRESNEAHRAQRRETFAELVKTREERDQARERADKASSLLVRYSSRLSPQECMEAARALDKTAETTAPSSDKQ